MFVVQDAKYFPGMKDLEKGFGATSYKVYSSTGNMLEKVSSGEHLLGYNMLGSYAMVRAKKDPNLGVVLPKDYTLVLSRVMFIGKKAKNPNAAKLWLDYILSQRGQKLIGSDVELFAVRDDVDAEYTAGKLKKEMGDKREADPGRPRDHRVPRLRRSAWNSSAVEGGRRERREVNVRDPGRRASRGA